MNEKFVKMSSFGLFNRMYTQLIIVVVLVYSEIAFLGPFTPLALFLSPIYSTWIYFKWCKYVMLFLTDNYQIKSRFYASLHPLLLMLSIGGVVLLLMNSLFRLKESLGAYPEYNIIVFFVILITVASCFLIGKNFANILTEVEDGNRKGHAKRMLISIGLYFSFIGVWFIQPRINKIYMEVMEDEAANSEAELPIEEE